MENKKNPFGGCTIVATGKLEHFTRDGINSKIASLGATAGSSVTRKTSYVICGEKPGSKLTKARELGIPVLTEQEFLSMMVLRSLSRLSAKITLSQNLPGQHFIHEGD